MDTNELIDKVNRRFGWTIKLKEKQIEIMANLVTERKKAVLAILPTGYGKSLLYILPPLMLNEVCSTL